MRPESAPVCRALMLIIVKGVARMLPIDRGLTEANEVSRSRSRRVRSMPGTYLRWFRFLCGCAAVADLLL